MTTKKSQCMIDFEKWYGFEVGPNMDIATEIAWKNWREAWTSAMATAFVEAAIVGAEYALTPAQKRAVTHVTNRLAKVV